MDLGYGVGDFIAVARLVQDISVRFINAPDEFRDTASQVATLCNVIREIEDSFGRHSPRESNKLLLATLSKECVERLEKLHRVLDQFQDLGSEAGPTRVQVRRIWKRLVWDAKHINGMRESIGWCLDAYNLFLTNLTREQYTELSSDVKQLTTEVSQWQSDQERQDMLEWITKKNYGVEQSDLSRLQQPGTGRWFLETRRFGEWMKGAGTTLFCPGIPGAGKTVMTSIVVDHLLDTFRSGVARSHLSSPPTGIVYIYCNFRRHEEQRMEDLLSSMLKQLVHQLPQVPEDMAIAYSTCKERGTRLSDMKMADLICSICPKFSKTFFLIDALDECQTSYETASNIVAFLSGLQSAVPNTNFFATARFIPELVLLFEGHPMIEIRAVVQDIHQYINGHISQLPPCAKKDANLQQEIVQSITQAVDGMFLLTRLHLESLRGKRSPKAIRTVLSKLPTGSNAYHGAYEEAMNRISGQLEDEKEVARDLLSWICSTQRPLTAIEIQHALAVEIGEDTFDEENMSELEWAISLCAGLVTHDQVSDVVRLVHYTAQEYFQQEGRRWFPHAASYLTTVCLTYVSFEAFNEGFCSSDAAFEDRCREYPLYKYATRNWARHLQDVDPKTARDGDGELTEELLLKFLTHEGNSTAAWQSALIAVFEEESSSRYDQINTQVPPTGITGLHLAAYHGLESVTALLIENEIEADLADTYGRTPLLWAAFKGHEATVKLLVAADVDTACKDLDGCTALLHAAEKGYSGIARMLLEAGADPNVRDGNDHTPLLWAVEKGDKELVELLLRHDVAVEALGASDYSKGTSPLCVAARQGNTEVIDVLLRSGASVETKDNLGRTAVMYAALHGREAAVKRLIQETQDLNISDQYGLTPVTGAANNGYFGVASLLLRSGVDPSVKNTEGESPLFRASVFGHLKVASLFLEAGADTETRNNEGYTPLLIAAKSGMFAVADLLLKHGADINARDGTGRTALSYAAQRGSVAMIILLVQNSADRDSQDEKGQTVAWWAEQTGNAAIFQLLAFAELNLKVEVQDAFQVSLQSGAGAKITCIRGDDDALFHVLQNNEKHSTYNANSILLAAAGRGLARTTQFLLQKGIGLKSRSPHGRTPLMLAALARRHPIVDLLVDHGADLEATDHEGATALLLATIHNSDCDEMVEVFIYAGAQVNVSDQTGRTPLSYAASRLRKSSIGLLIEHGGDVNAQDLEGKTALFWAVQHGNSPGAMSWASTELKQWSVQVDDYKTTVQSLLERGASADHASLDGETPLLVICRSKEYKPECVRLLIEHGVDPNSRDKNGRSALSLAAEVQNIAVMKMLLEKGADPNLEDQDGQSPIFRTVGDGDQGKEAAELLLEHGVDLEHRDHRGRTVLVCAVSEGKEEMVNMLVDRGAKANVGDYQDVLRTLQDRLRQL